MHITLEDVGILTSKGSFSPEATGVQSEATDGRGIWIIKSMN